MTVIAKTPAPPYYAVIFTAIASKMQEGYPEMVQRMHELAQESPGFLGMESAGGNFEITVSYWEDEISILTWRENAAHKVAQELGQSNWYEAYHVRIAKVERAYGFSD
ncbi:MAG: antibiotic biosynthesis monooxygenase [Crocinitomicaceae bacterium]